MNWAEFESAYADAKGTIAKARSIRYWAASILANSLRAGDIGSETFAAFKRELKSFDIRSGEWK